MNTYQMPGSVPGTGNAEMNEALSGLGRRNRQDQMSVHEELR